MRGEADEVITPPPLEGGGRGEGSVQAPPLLDYARAMRRDPTPAEGKLWHKLRNHRLGGLKFRRQMPVGPFIADFYCSSAKLVVELDGVSHMDSPTDERRDAWIFSYTRGRNSHLRRTWCGPSGWPGHPSLH